MSDVTRIAELRFGSFKALDARGLGQYALELVVVGLSYLVLAKVGWMMALAVEPGAPPIRPAAGLALAAVLLRGVRIWPAIFVSAWAASEQFGGTGLDQRAAGAWPRIWTRRHAHRSRARRPKIDAARLDTRSMTASHRCHRCDPASA